MLQQIYPFVTHSFQYELNKDLHFAAAHYIPSEEAGMCRNVHGHTYFSNITIVGDELDGTGFLVNFSDIKKLINDRFDHTILNKETLYFNDHDSNYFPTTEVMARTIWGIIQSHLDGMSNKPKCLQVYLRETPTSYVIFRPKAGV